MDENTLRRIELEIDDLRGRLGNIRNRDLVALARRLGRERHNRGNEPTYVHEVLPGRYPLSIPGHQVIKKYTAKRILDVLEEDIYAWRNWLSKQ